MPVYKFVFRFNGEIRTLYVHAESRRKAEDTAILLILLLRPALKLVELEYMGLDFTPCVTNQGEPI